MVVDSLLSTQGRVEMAEEERKKNNKRSALEMEKDWGAFAG